MLYYGAFFLIEILLSWGPIYLTITDGANWKFAWLMLLSELLIRALGFILSLTIYINLVKNRTTNIFVFFSLIFIYLALILISPINPTVILMNIFPLLIIVSIAGGYNNRLFKKG